MYKKQWIAFFSQTGSEIVALSDAIGRKPDLIVTNKELYNTELHPRLKSLGTIMYAKHNRLMEYFEFTNPYKSESTIITLHGYLRIVSESVCRKYKIYNGHPAAIDLYPELKGKDPQERTWENKGNYKFIGSVVHEVIPAVDEGKIVKSVHFTNTSTSLYDTYDMLKRSSLSAWTFAAKEIGLCELE